MAERKCKCIYCGRAFYTEVHNKEFCDSRCRDLLVYWARCHKVSLEDAKDHFTAMNYRKEREKEIKTRKEKKVVWVRVSSSSGYYTEVYV